MSAILLGSRKLLSAAKRLGLPLTVAFFGAVFALFAGTKAWHNFNTAGSAKTYKIINFNGKKVSRYKPVKSKEHGGSVSIDYGSHDLTFYTGKQTGLVPTSSGVDAPSPGTYGSPAILGSGLTFSQNGVTLDAAGNMYVNDQDSGTGNVTKISADGTSTTIIGSGFLAQSGNVAVDKTGNVYVVDQAKVFKIPVGATPGTYDAPVTINNTFSRPFAIAADTAGNIYVTDLGVGVYKMSNDGTGKVKIDNAIANGSGITVDATGNVYVCDYVSLALYEIPATGGTETQLATGFAFPRALAVDGAGNIYVGDEGVGTIYEVAPGGGTPVAVISGLTNNVGLAVDASYSLYIGLQGSGGVNKYSPVGGYFISPAVLPAGLSFDNTTGAILGKPTTITGGKTYIISGYGSGGGVSDTLRMSVAAPGPVPVVSYSNPNSLALGTGITPITPLATGVDAPGYGPNVPLAVNLANTGGVALDAAGNVYVALRADNTIRKLPADGSPAVNLGSGFASPGGVAVDASGNIYVADYGNGAVIKMSPDGLSSSSIGSGFSRPYAVALDAAGNVYVADQGLQAVFKILASDGSTVQLADSFSLLTGIAVDKTGQNIYVSDAAANSVYKVAATGGGATDLGASFAFPFSLALDPAGNLFVVDFDLANSIARVYKGDGRSANFVNTNITYLAPSGMAADASGNLFVGDFAANAVYETSPSGGYVLLDALPKGLKLNDTTGIITGTPTKLSTATDYHILAYNANGGFSVTVNIAVVLPPPPVISYTNPNIFTAGTTISALSPTPANTTAPAYDGDHQTVTNGFAGPTAPVSDAAGNIYVLDRANNLVKKIPADGSAPVPIATGFTFVNPTALAIDAAGNIYVADQGNNAIEKIATDGTTVTPVGGNFNFPVALAVDGANNIYVADLLDQAIYKILASNGSAVTLADGFGMVTGIAVDKTGRNIYVSDSQANSVYKLTTCGCGPEDLGYNFIAPMGVTLDLQGNLYVTDYDQSNSSGTLYKSKGDEPGACFVAISSSFNKPEGLTQDPSGNLFVADTGTGTLEKVTPTAGYFLSTPLPKGMKFNDTTGVITGRPTVLSAATDYKVTEYNLGGGTAALVNIEVDAPPAPTLSYTTPNVFPARTPITPLQPTSTDVARPDYAIAPVTIASGFNSPRATAVDKHGNVFVADSLNNRVVMIAADGSGNIPWGSGFSSPNGVAVDSLGNVYVSDYGNQLIKKIAPNGVMITQLAAVTAPTAVAVDAPGNVYYTNQHDGLVYKIDIATGNPVALTDTVFKLPHPTAIATDGKYVYVSDGYLGAVLKLSAGGGVLDIILPSSSPYFTNPTGLAVDAAGSLYISDEDDGVLYRASLNGHTASLLSTTGLGAPDGISVDANGNLYVADVLDDQVVKVSPAGGYYIDKALPAGLSFNSRTGVISGTPKKGSAATDYIATAYNLGGPVTSIFNIEVTVPPPPTISYAGPKVYTVNVPIPVLSPTLSNSAPIYYNTTPSVISMIPGQVGGIAINSTGDVYAASVDINTGASSVVKIPAGSGTPVTISTDFDQPANAAVDAAGNVYVADAGNGAIKKIPHGTGAPVTVVSGFEYPVGVAVDAAGNLYVADEGHEFSDDGAIYKVAAGTTTPVQLTGSDPLDPIGVAVDGAGNVYFIDSANGQAFELPGGSGTAMPVGPLLNSTGTITADNGGNIYFSDAIIGAIYIVPAGGGSVITIDDMGLPLGLAVDASGNLYTSSPGLINSTLNKTAPASGLFISPSLPAGLTFDGTTGNISGTPTALSPATDYTVTALNLGGSNSGVINVKVAAPSALLKKLSLNPATKLTKVSGSNYADYTGNVYGDVITSVKVIPITVDPSATLTINGVVSTPGVESAPVALNSDTTAIAVTVTAGDGVTKKTYRVVLTRKPSNVALLSTLSLNPPTSITRVTGPNYADYTGNVYGNAVTSVKVIPVAVDAGSTITINGVAATSGVESAPVTLNADTTAIAVTVTAADGTTKKTYRMVLTRLASNNARLTILSLNPKGGLTLVPGPDFADYTSNVYGNVTSVKVTPITAESTATLTINGVASTPGVESAPVALNADTTAIAVTVTAGDRTTKKTYRIVVTRLPSNNALLTTLSLNPATSLTRVTGPNYADYTANIYGLASTVKVIPVTSDNTAMVTVAGMPTTSGTESAPVALNADTTSIPVTVTAFDGVTKKTYRILITRLPSNNALLTTLSLNPRVKLTQVPGADYADYTASVTNSTSSVKVIPVTSDNTATVKVNGMAATSGVESAPVTLHADTTSIPVTVTAFDGTTKKSYVILVTRLAPPPNVMAYEAPKEMPINSEAITVHQNVSPNGDGRSDALQIDGITNYPDNKLQIMSRAGNLVYEAKGYDNTTKVFDGHSNDGKLQQAGTYFYSLEYKVGNEIKRKTGYIVLRY